MHKKSHLEHGNFLQEEDPKIPDLHVLKDLDFKSLHGTALTLNTKHAADLLSFID